MGEAEFSTKLDLTEDERKDHTPNGGYPEELHERISGQVYC